MTDAVSTNDQLAALFATYTAENAKFEAGNKSAGTRARKALMEIIKAAKTRRVEIQETKNA
jgi:hypothetical protein